MNTNLFTILTAFLCFVSMSITAQDEFTLKGVVKDANNESLPGVSVIVKGTNSGGITNFNGEFSLQAKSGDTLVCSFIGMKTKEVAVNNESFITVTLQENVEQLEEVVVTGYGEMRKRDLTGSLTQIDESTDVKTQFSTVDGLLQGRSAGVQVIGNDGSAGGATSVKIRGTNSLRGNNEPLYVVDGVIVSTAGEGMSSPFEGGEGYAMGAQNGLAGINPRDIESMEVLKDASATAIYGSRGANGVILITTKKGEKGTEKVTAYANTSISQFQREIDVLDGHEYAAFINEIKLQQGTRPMYNIDPVTKEVSSFNNGDVFKSVNWQDEVYQQAVSYNAGATLSGGSKKSNYYIAANYRNNQGLQSIASVNGGDLRINYSRNVSDKFNFNIKSSLYYSSGSYSQSGLSAGGNASIVTQAIMSRPLEGGSLADGDTENEDTNNTPLTRMLSTDDLTEELRSQLSLNMKYKFNKYLTYNLRAGADIRLKDREVWYGPGTTRGDRSNGTYNQSSQDRRAFTIDNLLMYNRTFNKKHRINTTIGATYDGVLQDNQVYGVADFGNKTYRTEFPQLGRTVIMPFSKTRSDYTVLSGLARANYSFKNRYILTASVRADGSSKFRPDRQWGYFPSLSTAWYISDEPWMKGLKTLSNLKLRAGWGQTGNQSVPPYRSWQSYTTGRYVDINGNTITTTNPINFENPNITWETTAQTNVGIDLGFFDDRITLVTDIYYKQTDDLLQQVQIPNSSGFGNYLTNRGSLESKGIEFALSTVAYDKNDFKLEVGGNISFNRTVITDLGVPPSTFFLNGKEVTEQMIQGSNIATGYVLKAPANIFVVGEQLGLIYGYETNGIYKSAEEAAAGAPINDKPVKAGDVRFVDQNGDGKITPDDRTTIGNPNPKFNYGINLNASYKNLSLAVLFTGVYGNDLLNSGMAFYGYPDPMWNSNNVRRDVYQDNWSESNTNGNNPRVGYGYTDGYNNLINDRVIEDGSYLRLSTVTLSYNVPTAKLGMKKVKYLNVYATGRNLFLLTNYTGYDPEITSYLYDGTILGVDWQTMPNPRTFIFGFNLTF
ncbi:MULTISPECIES: SusC/RagA family TonB-linked outer membrane protein [Flammeovirga]|uniref:TonB-dependent receptor n=1 Tax=Flammeovirga agarivorans TaxID=2726742 RepID=A0A7X8SKI9_9BACT|nr:MULTISPECIES: TonB-dependent receptor [Flammeovirga]NLR91855.1 TonB-dependent receptor [Flammeovirga agarivorans]